MKTKKNLAAPRKEARRGAMIVLVAALLIALFGMCAFTVDLGHVAATNATLRAAADASALAAAGNMTQVSDYGDIKAVAIQYAQMNVPENYGSVIDDQSITFGIWIPATNTFVPDNINPNAVRVVVERSQQRGNEVPYFLAKIFGQDSTDLSAEAIAVGPVTSYTSTVYNSVYVTSTKDLSNVVLEFADGEHQKFEGLSGYTGTFAGTGEHVGKEVVGVWVKSGANSSSDGPGYGERIDNPGDGSTVHGVNQHSGPIPHVTATFQASGAEFSDSGSTTPVRLVR